MQIIFASIITVLVFIAFITEIVPVPVTAVCGAILMGVFNVVEMKSVFSGFSNDVTLTIIGTSIVGAALFETNVVVIIGNLLKRNVAKNEKTFLVAVIVFSAILSAFLSNIAVTAMFIPIVASVCASSNNRISKGNIMMYVGIASGVGGLCTLIGSPPQLLANGMLTNAGFEGFSFFELSIVGIPLLVLLIIYALTIGYKLIVKCGIKDEPVETELDEEIEDNVPKHKKIIAIVILILMIAGFCTQVYSIGAISMISAMLMLLTGCISFKSAIKQADWSSALTIAGSLGFASALEKSGVCQLVANKTVSILGENSTAVVYSLVLLFICMILTNIISNVACTTMFVPIAISIASATGIGVKTLVLAVVFGASISWATPIASPPMTMVMEHGHYKFKDYLKVGGPYCVLACLLTAAILLIAQ